MYDSRMMAMVKLKMEVKVKVSLMGSTQLCVVWDASGIESEPMARVVHADAAATDADRRCFGG